MTDREARRVAVVSWILEFSVLWAVLPIVDQLLAAHPLDFWITIFSGLISLTTLTLGVMLKRGEGM